MIDTIEIPPRPSWLKRKPTRTTDAAERAAHKLNVDPAAVLALMPEALALIRQHVETIELARGRARQLTGLDARIIASRENKYLDHSTHPRFDETSRELAAEFPELGFDPDAHDTPQRVWEFIREGKQPIPVRHSDIVAELAASWCEKLETEDFPDDADGFNPAEWESPVYVAGAHHPACDVQQKEELCQSRQAEKTSAAPFAQRSGIIAAIAVAQSAPMSLPEKVTADAGRGFCLPCAASSPTLPPERNRHADENPSRHVRLSPPWTRSARRIDRRRETTRPVAGGRTLPPVRSERLARHLVRPAGPGRDPGHREAAGRRIHRLGRITWQGAAYVAGSGIPASIRVRDGPRMIRHPVSVA